MCGIVGFVGEGDARVLAAMRAAVAHRGPDDDATWTGQAGGRAVAFGFRRLAIIDLQGGAQPMVAADGRIVVMNNGEIYNFRELRRELEGLGHRFVSDHADTEVLVHGYRQWGEGIVDRLDGMFAFAILDRAAGRLFLGRDRFGKKPLYLAEVAGGLVFGSELRAVARHPAVARRIDRDALAQYFAFGYVPAPRTLFQGIGKLRAGETVVYDLATLASQRRRYWTYRVRSRDPLAGGPEDWAVELRRLLDRAVERRLVSDVPLGFFLSGGIDSSAVVGLARGHLGAAALKTFTIGFETKDYDESPLADLVARRFQTDHTVDVLDLDKAAGLAREVLGRIDEPFVDDAVIPNFLLARLARRHVTVVLSGDGGDEMFAGYDTFPVLSLAKAYYRTVPTAVHGLIR
ncbi:MAG: asparagine synthase (glutamine-hydrolyzing), partial [Alphaproteobacteria bacterium]|nr:asparagine synthase (glutamine-hydrolyzing) [Alphaproteobacteria bacterium]